MTKIKTINESDKTIYHYVEMDGTIKEMYANGKKETFLALIQKCGAFCSVSFAVPFYYFFFINKGQDLSFRYYWILSDAERSFNEIYAFNSKVAFLRFVKSISLDGM